MQPVRNPRSLSGDPASTSVRLIRYLAPLLCLVSSGCNISSFHLEDRKSPELPRSVSYSVMTQDLPEINGISVSSTEEIWAVGDGGYLLHSLNGGREWQESTLGGFDLLAITRTSRGTLLVSSRDGLINRSVDGKNWRRVDTPTTSDLFA